MGRVGDSMGGHVGSPSLGFSHYDLPSKCAPHSSWSYRSALPGLGSFMFLGLADFLQLALMSVSFDSALPLLPCVLSLTHDARCFPFCPVAPWRSWQQSESYFGAATCCPGGPAHRGFSWGGGALLHLSFPEGSLISSALQSHGAGCAVPLTR